MTTKILKQGTVPRDDGGGKGETFFFEDLELSKDMRMCRNCGELYGPLRPGGGDRSYLQTCRCDKKFSTPLADEELKKDLHLDFGQAVTLCFCCGQVLMKSGWKFSGFFCASCRPMVVKFDTFQGFCLIPLGRHSLMNGIALSGKGIHDEKAIFKFVEGCNSLFKRIDLLSDWKKLVVAKNLKRIGHTQDRDIDLFSYLRNVRPDFWSQFSAFDGIRKFFLNQYKATPDENSVSPETAVDDSGQKPQK